MLVQIIAVILTAIGDILIGISVVKVHEAFSKERRIDNEVIKEIKEEHVYVFAGITFILAGLLFQLISIFLI